MTYSKFVNLLVIILCQYNSLTSGIRSANFDIYPIRADGEKDSGGWQLLSGVKDVISVTGGLYAGFMLAKTVIRMIRPRKVGNFSSYEELYDDQQELWRVVHKLFTSQSEKILSLSNHTSLYQERLNEQLQSLQSGLKEDMNSLSLRMSAIELLYDKTETLENKLKYLDETKLQDLEKNLRDEIDNLKSIVKSLQKEIRVTVDHHDEAMLSKLREYMHELKETLVSKGTIRKKS